MFLKKTVPLFYICYIIIPWYEIFQMVCIFCQYLRSVPLLICIYKGVIGEQEGIHGSHNSSFSCRLFKHL